MWRRNNIYIPPQIKEGKSPYNSAKINFTISLTRGPSLLPGNISLSVISKKKGLIEIPMKYKHGRWQVRQKIV